MNSSALRGLCIIVIVFGQFSLIFGSCSGFFGGDEDVWPWWFWGGMAASAIGLLVGSMTPRQHGGNRDDRTTDKHQRPPG